MSSYDTFTILCWLIFIAYWVLASIHVKRDRNAGDPWQSSSFAITMALLFLISIATLAEQKFLWELFSIYSIVPQSSSTEALGTMMCALGISIAIWARVHLGRNWSSEPAIKEGHVLVTTGPYYFVRHPIYAGVLLASLGSTLVGGSVWIFVLIAIANLLFFRMRKEERLLSEEFPTEYPAYMRRTRALIPLLL